MERLSNYIDGQLTPPGSGRYLDNFEPATGQVYSQTPDSGDDDLTAAVAAAERAADAWRATSSEERAGFLHRIAYLANANANANANADALARAESVDSGKPISLAGRLDIPRASANLQFFAAAATQFFSEAHPMAGDAFNYTLRDAPGGMQRPRCRRAGAVDRFSYWAEPKDAHDLSRLLNDHIAGVVTDHPRRFVGLGTVPMQDPDLAVQELERCVTTLGLAGIQIGTHVNGKNLDDERVFPVLEAAEALGAAVFVHPWDMLARDRMSRYWLSWLVGMPAETALAICSMLFGGVFDRLPRLRVAFAHGGGAFPGTVGRIEHGFQVRPDLCAVETKTSPRDQLGRFYVDALVHDEVALRHLIDLVGAGRVALGTDYPFPLGELSPGALIESLGLEASTRERLLAGSALEWLNLEPGRFA